MATNFRSTSLQLVQQNKGAQKEIESLRQELELERARLVGMEEEVARYRQQEQEWTRCKVQLAENDKQLQLLSAQAEDATRRLTQSSAAATGLQVRN